jgi:D-arabinose 1-dehydrogenase-like Zn-dependent alcohol dehydrogenase
MGKMAGKLDIILSTVPAAGHEISAFERLLNDDGVVVQLGVTKEKKAIASQPLTDRRTQIVGSVVSITISALLAVLRCAVRLRKACCSTEE